jgi:serine/threonine protein kinase
MSDQAITLEPDAQIAQYRVISKLGQGGMGAVYLAEHTLLGRKAALKILHPSLTQREDIVERFFNEARAATSIADPGIVQIFDFGYQDDLAYIVMELLEGESLDARLSRLGQLPISDALRLARQMSLSLYAAHRHRVVHRDLKPENVFIVPDPEASGGERTKILDFGIAKLTDGEQNHKRTQTGMMMGTPIYMSPEQCRGSGTLDHRSDIYSLGCLLFHLLAGRPPFDYENGGELIAAHLKEPAPPPSQFVAVSPTIDSIVGRCLEKVPDQRFESMRELASALDAAMRGVTGAELARMTPLPTMSPVPAITVPPPRRRWWIPIATAAVIAVGAIVVVAVMPHGDKAAAPIQTAPPPPPPTPTPTPAPPPPVAQPAIVQPVPVTPPPIAEPEQPKPAPAHTVVRHRPSLGSAATPVPQPTPPQKPPPPTTPTPPAVVDPYSDR